MPILVGGLFAVAVEADQRFANEFAFQIVLGEKFVVVDGIVVVVFDDFFGHGHQFVGHFAVVGEQGRGSRRQRERAVPFGCCATRPLRL